MSRKVHTGSNIRMLISVCTYSALQAAVVTTLTQLLLPESVVEGQGALSLPVMLWETPGLWLNAFNNTVYWVAQVYVLREPLGVVLVVLAFLVASFGVNPLSYVVGLPVSNHLSALPVILGVVGTLLCLAELNKAQASAILHHLSCGTFGQRLSAGYSHVSDRTPETGAAGSPGGEGQIEMEDVRVDEANVSEIGWSSAAPADRARGKPMSFAGLGVAFLVLALTASSGIVITVYYERTAGINMFGYAAMDQMLLPVTTLPVVAAACHFPKLARLLGEPAVDVARIAEKGTGFRDQCSKTWAETHLMTLMFFRGLQFGREFLFFALATEYDLDSTYLEMTLLRVALSWMASLAACTLLRSWVMVSEKEAKLTLAPVNMALRACGTVLVLVSTGLINSEG